jgi:uridine phosphorylase
MFENGLQYHIKMQKRRRGGILYTSRRPRPAVRPISSYFTEAREVARNREYLVYTGRIGGKRVSGRLDGIGGLRPP